MAAVERLEVPTDEPAVGRILYEVKRDDAGRQQESKMKPGTFFTSWGVVVKVISHPDVPAGQDRRVYLNEREWNEFLATGAKKGDVVSFQSKPEKNEDTNKWYGVIRSWRDGAEDAPPGRPAPRASATAPTRSAPAQPGGRTALDACLMLESVFTHLTENGVPAEQAGPMATSVLIAIGRGEVQWGGFETDKPSPF